MPTMRVCPTCGGRDLSATAPQRPSVPIGSAEKQVPFKSASQSFNTGSQTGPSVLADRGSRLGAATLDFLIYALSVIPGAVMPSSSDSDMAKGIAIALMSIGFIAMAITQWVYLVRYGQTLGKKMLGIRIVKMSNESIPSFQKIVLLRTFVPALLTGIPFAGFIFFLVDVLLIFRDDRRCVHDLIAETKVIKCNP